MDETTEVRVVSPGGEVIERRQARVVDIRPGLSYVEFDDLTVYNGETLEVDMTWVAAD